MTTNTETSTVADQKIVNGCNKRLMTLGTVTVGGTAMKPADIVAKVQTRIDATSALEAADAAFHKAVTNNKDTRTQTHQFMLDLRAAIRVLFGIDLVALADFGLEPPKARTKKPAVLVAAAEPVTPPAPAATPTPAKYGRIAQKPGRTARR